MTGCDVTNTDLERSDVGDSDMTGVTLKGAILHSTNLAQTVNLTAEQVNSAKIDKKTALPPYLEVEWTSKTAFECKARQ